MGRILNIMYNTEADGFLQEKHKLMYYRFFSFQIHIFVCYEIILITILYMFITVRYESFNSVQLLFPLNADIQK